MPIFSGKKKKKSLNVKKEENQSIKKKIQELKKKILDHKLLLISLKQNLHKLFWEQHLHPNK